MVARDDYTRRVETREYASNQLTNLKFAVVSELPLDFQRNFTLVRELEDAQQGGFDAFPEARTGSADHADTRSCY